jgi:hypothetical protein
VIFVKIIELSFQKSISCLQYSIFYALLQEFDRKECAQIVQNAENRQNLLKRGKIYVIINWVSLETQMNFAKFPKGER